MEEILRGALTVVPEVHALMALRLTTEDEAREALRRNTPGELTAIAACGNRLADLAHEVRAEKMRQAMP